MRSYDDIVHQVIKTGFQNYVVDWTNNGEMLAVAGKAKDVPSRADHSFTYVNAVKFYNDEGNLIYQVLVPSIKVRSRYIIMNLPRFFNHFFSCRAL